MKALMLVEYNRFVLTDVPDPRPGQGDVLVRVKACGICGSDVHGMDGSTGRRRPPVIMGHEASGVIAETGEGVSGWRPGDRVTFDSTVYCGACDFCRCGQVNLCDRRRVLGVSCEEYRCHGAFAEFVVVPQHILYRLPEAVTFEQAAMVEALSVAVHAVRRAGTRPQPVSDRADAAKRPVPPSPSFGQKSAVVVGTGMIGLLVVQALRVAGWPQIIAVDQEERRLQMARDLGAVVTIPADGRQVDEEVRRLTGGLGVDAAFEVVGAAATVQTALGVVRKGGTVVLVGNLAREVTFPLQAVVTRELNVLGSCASSGEYPECLDSIARGDVNVNALISAVAPLSEGAQWFERLQRKEPGLMKVVLRV